MKINHVTPGLMSIPSDGWGAIEKVIWNYNLSFQKIGHDCQIKYLNDVDPKDTDVVHIHVANLAIEAKKRGIPYIFSLHDHHVFRFGRSSGLYEQNLEAIKNSIISFTHAEFLVDFFESTDKLFYLPHGVDTDLYLPYKDKNLEKNGHSLLCIANNGFADDPGFDRKGFRSAIEAASFLNLPITIAGPPSNNNFFDRNRDLLEYPKLKLLLNNPAETEIIELYNSHSIFLHPSILEAGHPNLTILESISCGTPVIGTYKGGINLESIIRTGEGTGDIIRGINFCIDNYDSFKEKINKDRKSIGWGPVCLSLSKIYENVIKSRTDLNSDKTTERLIKFIESSEKFVRPPLEIENFNINYINGAFCEIRGNSNSKYLVEFLDGSGKLEYSSEIESNMWTRVNKKYFSDSMVRVSKAGQLILEEKYDAGDKKVLISLDSKALGDTLAWIPYVEEFRKKHNCHVICSTFWNDLFIGVYPEIKFVPPGSVVNGIYAMYYIGWFYKDGIFDPDRNPVDFKNIPLQKTASDILGLDYVEIKPRIKCGEKNKKIKKIGIGIHSTAQSKYWNNPNGWQEVVDFLKSSGYEVILYSREEDGYMGNKNPSGVSKFPAGNISDLIEDMLTCEFYIGIGSGLSWLAWSLGVPVVLISGFSKEHSEMSSGVHRVINKNVCHGCFNHHRLDPSDWSWCPLHKGTDRAFECTREIKSESVIEMIEKLISKT